MWLAYNICPHKLFSSFVPSSLSLRVPLTTVLWGFGVLWHEPFFYVKYRYHIRSSTIIPPFAISCWNPTKRMYKDNDVQLSSFFYHVFLFNVKVDADIWVKSFHWSYPPFFYICFHNNRTSFVRKGCNNHELNYSEVKIKTVLSKIVSIRT